jgi:hypothetical protein
MGARIAVLEARPITKPALMLTVGRAERIDREIATERRRLAADALEAARGQLYY